MMFNPYDGSLSSTGEPPTESSSETSAQNIISSGNDSHQDTNLFLGSSRSLSVQEPDSGYEASPSSIAEGHSNQRFFGEQSASRQAEIRQVTSDDELDWEFTGFHFSESESELDEYLTCDCSSSPCSCFRTDSSTTNFTAISNCDNSRCNSSELSFHRPSSHPIQIPNVSSFRISSDVSSRIDVINPLTRSFPMDFSPRLRLDLIPERLPLSWPIASPLRNRTVALSVPRSNSSNRDTHMNNNRLNLNRQHPARNRRNIIDSEGSSYSSSEDEGSEDDVFHMPSGETSSSYPTMMTMSSIAPLPDVVLESTDSGRRSRSMSINLPPDREQVLNDIGQRLRRMSDLFVQRRQLRMAVMRARSRTASECDDHLHRNGLS